MSAHEEHWVVFEREVDDAPALLRVDVGWADEDHDGLALPAIVEFAVVFKIPSQDSRGTLPTAGEFDDIAALEDELVTAMAPSGSVLVAAMGSTNTRRWVFQAPSVETAETALDTVTNPADYEIEARAGDDPSWSMYHDFFLPDDEEMSLIANEGVFRALAEAGDIPERERPIEHLVYLPTHKAADEFATWATSRGFDIKDRFESEDAEDDMPSFAVEFSRVGPATMDAVMPDIDAATERAESLDGFYDGWQTAPVTQ
jgi:hypothetical protein